MTGREDGGGDFTQAFDAENRLQSVAVGGQTTYFYYDADGNRILTIQHDGVRVYTPFAEFEETVAGTTVTQRSNYYLAGQLIATRVKKGATEVYYYAYADHLGSIVAWSWTGGTPPVTGYLSRYEPFGGYRTRPDVTINPDISTRGFTGHRGNNTGTLYIQNLNLIYMNARYYMPEIGRFISADTIVPSPKNPQSYNRYTYVLNNPLNNFDPSGHREIGANENDLLPYQPPAPTLDQLTHIEPVFVGLPIEGVEWVNGYGPNLFAYNNPDVYAAQSAGIHPGMDFGKAYDPSCPSCMLVYANVSGTISDMWGGDADPNVVIELDNGMFVVYGHVLIDPRLVVGTRVNVGDAIGMLQDQRNGQYDNTHVHLSLREGTRTYNPAYFFADPSVLDNFAWNYPSPESLHKVSSYRYTPGKSYWNVEDRKHLSLAEW